jgi:hypothetical protein
VFCVVVRGISLRSDAGLPIDTEQHRKFVGIMWASVSVLFRTKISDGIAMQAFVANEWVGKAMSDLATSSIMTESDDMRRIWSSEKHKDIKRE